MQIGKLDYVQERSADLTDLLYHFRNKYLIHAVFLRHTQNAQALKPGFNRCAGPSCCPRLSGLILLPPSFNLLIPSFQCGFSRCIRRRSSDNNFVTIIEDFRLVSVSPHPQLFEPSPMDEPRVNFRVHEKGNDAMRKQFLGGW